MTDLSDLLGGVKGVIFDFDGTLFGFRGLALNVALANVPDLLIVREERRLRKELKGTDFQSPEAYYTEFFADLSRRTGKSAASLRSWYFERYMPNMCRILERKYKARPRVPEVFDALKGAGIKCAVYSDYPAVAERLEAIGLSPDQCGALYGPDTFGALKPAPRPFLAIAEYLHCAPGDTLVIGDREDTDGDGARASGMRFVLLNTGKNKRCKADTFASWDELADVLLSQIQSYCVTNSAPGLSKTVSFDKARYR